MRLLIALLFCLSLPGCASPEAEQSKASSPLPSRDAYTYLQGGITRGDTAQSQLALVFTGDSFAEGGEHILSVLSKQSVKANFFFTGNFYRNPDFESLILDLKTQGHYLGAHSDRHLLYCSWEKRDSLLVTKAVFTKDLADNYAEMERLGIQKEDAPFFMPPYEWYNDSISAWTHQWGLQLINYTPGTLSHTDYTTDELPNYRDSETIYQSVLDFEAEEAAGLNGFILLVHIGAGPGRTDKFYLRLEELLGWLGEQGYSPVRIDELLDEKGLH